MHTYVYDRVRERVCKRENGNRKKTQRESEGVRQINRGDSEKEKQRDERERATERARGRERAREGGDEREERERG